MEPSSNELADLLGQHPELESSGTFTVRVDRLATRLRTDLFEQRECYLLKLLQAAVAAGAAEIKVTIGRREVKVEFAAEVELLEPSEFRRALLLESTGCEARDLLAVGSGAALAFEGAEVELTHGPYRVRLNSDDLKLDSLARPSEICRFVLRRSWRYWRARVTEHTLVYQRFASIRTRVILDGRGLVSQLASSSERMVYGKGPLADLGIGELPGPSLPARLNGVPNPVPENCKALRLLIPYKLQGRGRLYIIKWGVALEPVSWSAHRSGTWGYWVDDAMPTDITGMKPRVGERLERTVKGLDQFIGEWLKLTYRLLIIGPEEHGIFGRNAGTAGGASIVATTAFLVKTCGWPGLIVSPVFGILAGSGAIAGMGVLELTAGRLGSQANLVSHVERRLRQILGRSALET